MAQRPRVRLLHLPYSPWSEKAKWALEFHRIEFEAVRYEPILGEPKLRVALRRFRGPVGVPCLQVGRRWIADSVEIARWADENSARDDGKRLMPAEHRDVVQRYNELSERGLAFGRVRSLGRLLHNRAGLRSMVPPDLRKLGPLATGVAKIGVHRTLRKYANLTREQDVEAGLVRILDTLRQDIARSPAPKDGGTDGVAHLLTEFSYADIAMAQVLAFVDPPPTHLRMSHATRDSFHDPQLAPRYEDLVKWRDALYVHFRGPDRRH